MLVLPLHFNRPTPLDFKTCKAVLRQGKPSERQRPMWLRRLSRRGRKRKLIDFRHLKSSTLVSCSGLRGPNLHWSVLEIWFQGVDVLRHRRREPRKPSRLSFGTCGINPQRVTNGIWNRGHGLAAKFPRTSHRSSNTIVGGRKTLMLIKY